jgi:hypothetical protein
VTLKDFHLTRGNFPSLPDKGAALQRKIESGLGATVQTIPLNHLQASLAIASDRSAKGHHLRNDPPAIFVSYAPAILIPTGGGGFGGRFGGGFGGGRRRRARGGRCVPRPVWGWASLPRMR